MGMAHLAAELYHRKSFAGKISLLISGWKVLISDHLVLETVIEEYHIPLTSTAGQKSWPHTPHLPTREFASLEKEIKTVPEADSVRSPSHNKGFYSIMFIVTKKNGSQRPLINLTSLNKHEIKMKGLYTVN